MNIDPSKQSQKVNETNKNECRQKMSEEYVKPSEGDILLDNDATKRTLTSLYETLSQQGVDVS